MLYLLVGPRVIEKPQYVAQNKKESGKQDGVTREGKYILSAPWVAGLKPINPLIFREW